MRSDLLIRFANLYSRQSTSICTYHHNPCMNTILNNMLNKVLIDLYVYSTYSRSHSSKIHNSLSNLAARLNNKLPAGLEPDWGREVDSGLHWYIKQGELLPLVPRLEWPLEEVNDRHLDLANKGRVYFPPIFVLVNKSCSLGPIRFHECRQLLLPILYQ